MNGSPASRLNMLAYAAAKVVEREYGSPILAPAASLQTGEPIYGLDGIPTPTPAPSKREQVRARLLRSNDIRNLTPASPLIDGWIDRGSFSVSFGKPESYKSFVAVDMAACVATGRPWHGHDITQGPALYIVAEGSAGMAQRWEAWQEFNGVDGTGAPLYWLPMSLDLRDPSWAEAVAEAVAPHGPMALTVVDTVFRTFGGGDENSSADMGAYIAGLDLIRARTGSAVLAVHHPGKSEAAGARGHSSLRAALDVEIEVQRRGHKVTVQSTKQKDRAAPQTLTFTATPVLDSLALAPTLTEVVEDVARKGGEMADRIRAVIAVVSKKGDAGVESMNKLIPLVRARLGKVSDAAIRDAAAQAIEVGCLVEITGSNGAKGVRYVRTLGESDLVGLLS
jgi:hypothetical protein